MFQSIFLKIIAFILPIIVLFSPTSYTATKTTPINSTSTANILIGTSANIHSPQTVVGTTTSPKTATKVSKIIVSTTAKQSVTAPLPALPVNTNIQTANQTASTISFEHINDVTRAALVNIICTTQS